MLASRSETPIWSRHLGNHLLCDLRRFGGDGFCAGGAGGVVAPSVRVPAGGDEEGEVEESVLIDQ